MGWFFNQKNSKTQQNDQTSNQNNSHYGFTSHSSSSSMTKKCQTDPEDNRFLICKTVIKDENGTREEQERIPANKNYGNGFAFQTPGSDSLFRNFLPQDENAFDKFQSFLIQPSFLDMHNSSNIPTNENEFQSFSRSYSKSRTCKQDPEDNEYLICQQKISDENGTREVQERVKMSNQLKIPSFKGEFTNFGHEIDREIHNLMGEINQGFNMMMPFAGLFMNFVNDLENLEKNFSSQQNQSNHHYFPSNSNYRQNKPDENDNRYFSTSQTKKDTNIYDL